MPENDHVFVGAVPEVYDDYLVPLIFECYANDLARRVASRDPAAVLETAAGSGVVTRAVAPCLRADAHYAVSDLNPPMLERARARQPDDARIGWAQADATALPYDDASFDMVICQFGVMFFPDRVQGYREARRVLRPGGAFVFNVWDRIEDNVFADLATRAAADCFPDNPPRFLTRTPHGYHDTLDIAADLRSAGFADFDIETITDESPAPSPLQPAIAYCQGTPLRDEILLRDPDALQRVTAAAAARIGDAHGPGPVTARIQAHVITAVR